MSICRNQAQRDAWEELSIRFDNEACDGINAEGNFSEEVLWRQKYFLKGLRSGRLSAFNAINRHEGKEDDCKVLLHFVTYCDDS